MRHFEIVDEKRVYEGFFDVVQGFVRYEGRDGRMGEVQDRLNVERGDAVGLVLYHRERDRLLFVRQFRYPLIRHDDPWPLEIVAGQIDEGEAPEESARREAEEETGYRVGDLEFIAKMYSSPGGTSEALWLYYAEVSEAARESEAGGVEGEEVELVELAPDEVWAMLDRQEICDAKTLIGLQWLRLRGT
jgi:nudix-type nucleoside diphosphatase (YffH/AdpP family)